MNYEEDEIQWHRNIIQKKYIKIYQTTREKIWHADNNGQITQNETCNSVGKWDLADKDGKETVETTSKPLRGII